MSLEGSLNTIALPEVLSLLARTSKTGELRVDGDGARGRLWFEGGKLGGYHVGRTHTPVDALFDLLRVREGTFEFDSDAVRADGADSAEVDVTTVVAEAERRLGEWSAIVETVPSLFHRLGLVDSAPAEEVRLSPPQWALVVAVGEGHNVGETIDRLQLGEFDGCRAVKELIDVGLAAVESPPAEEPVGPSWFQDEAIQDEAIQDEAIQDEAIQDEAIQDEAIQDEAVEDEPEPHLHAAGSFWPTALDDRDDDVFHLDDPSDDEDPEVLATTVHATTDPGAQAEHRATLQELIADLASHAAELDPDGEVDGEVVDGEVEDGLLDRGPWTHGELASLERHESWASDGPADFEDDDVEDTEAVVPAPESPVEEPINRGLLLKFLSSVRN